MNENILTALYNNYANDAFKNFKATTFSELENETERLEAFAKAHSLAFDDLSDLNDIVFTMTNICEQKSFINGLKFGAQMALELLNSSQTKSGSHKAI